MSAMFSTRAQASNTDADKAWRRENDRSWLVRRAARSAVSLIAST
jgi:hypothetical protein